MRLMQANTDHKRHALQPADERMAQSGTMVSSSLTPSLPEYIPGMDKSRGFDGRLVSHLKPINNELEVMSDSTRRPKPRTGSYTLSARVGVGQGDYGSAHRMLFDGDMSFEFASGCSLAHRELKGEEADVFIGKGVVGGMGILVWSTLGKWPG